MFDRKQTQGISHLGNSKRPKGAEEADQRFAQEKPNQLLQQRVAKSTLRENEKSCKWFLNWLPEGEKLIDAIHVDVVLCALAHEIYDIS